uniref:Uncharacterized protein n=1 Tax=Glycine max TaxID=3847 RepID=C6T1J8_SOYBN|nr:unknown [Glycine max]
MNEMPNRQVSRNKVSISQTLKTVTMTSIYIAAIAYTFIKCKFNLSLIIMTSIMKDDLTFSSPTQADRISHIFPQSRGLDRGIWPQYPAILQAFVRRYIHP